MREFKQLNKPFTKENLVALLKDFKCERCGDCCRHWDIPILDSEIPFIGSEKLLEGADSIKRLKTQGGCPFQKGNDCSIYEHRPLACRISPIYNGDSTKILLNGNCPVIRRMNKCC